MIRVGGYGGVFVGIFIFLDSEDDGFVRGAVGGRNGSGGGGEEEDWWAMIAARVVVFS